MAELARMLAGLGDSDSGQRTRGVTRDRRTTSSPSKAVTEVMSYNL